VRLDWADAELARATVIDTNTRHVSAAEAFGTVLEIMRRIPETARVYKKTDSTLRGNIAAELAALCSARPTHRVVYAPAYPEVGRTVVGGVLLVHGTAVERTAFATDPRSPVTESSIPAMLASAGVQTVMASTDMSSIVGALEDAPAGLIVCDGAADADLLRVADAVRERGDIILAGPGGIARFWVRSLEPELSGPPATPRARRWLVVCGSMHPVSRRQVRAAEEIGLRCLTSADVRRDTGDALGDLVQEAEALVRRGDADGLMLFGGETARAVLLRLGCRRLSPLFELLPGVPLALAHASFDHIPVVTKAGGFGDENLVECILKKLAV
jgi:uncharacterized protein YgbK (DUF1537 family)